ncbi:MAG TPA: hypothetical protein VJ397_01395 [Thermoplasmata archaeon]|nr:hypothetical protein [Thermoplasmata archaeon]
MRAFLVHAADVAQAARFTASRLVRRPFSLPFFALLLVGSLWLILRTVELAGTADVPEGLRITPDSLLFAAFLLSLGKGAADAYYRMVRHPALVFLLAQPVRRSSIAAGKLWTVVALNLGFVTLCLGVATALLLGFRIQVPAGGAFVPALVAAVLGGLASGFALAVAASLGTWRRKAVGLGLLAGLPAAAWIALVQVELPVEAALPALIVLALASVLAALATSPWLAEAWNAQAASRSGAAGHTLRPLRPPWLTAAGAAVFDKEVKTAWRKRETVLSLATLVFVAIALASVYTLLGGPPSGRFARLLLPVIAMAGVFAGAAVTMTVRGLSAIGGEHESLWILRTSPVPGVDVARGKAAAHALLLPALAGVGLPLALLAGFPWDTSLLVVVSGLTVGLAMTAVGVHFGARSPSFDRNTGGLPDSLTLYGIFMIGLVACVLFVAPPGALFAGNRVLGLLAAILAADLAALALYAAVRRAGPHIDRVEL